MLLNISHDSLRLTKHANKHSLIVRFILFNSVYAFHYIIKRCRLVIDWSGAFILRLEGYLQVYYDAINLSIDK